MEKDGVAFGSKGHKLDMAGQHRKPSVRVSDQKEQKLQPKACYVNSVLQMALMVGAVGPLQGIF